MWESVRKLLLSRVWRKLRSSSNILLTASSPTGGEFGSSQHEQRLLWPNDGGRASAWTAFDILVHAGRFLVGSTHPSGIPYTSSALLYTLELRIGDVS